MSINDLNYLKYTVYYKQIDILNVDYTVKPYFGKWNKELTSRERKRERDPSE